MVDGYKNIQVKIDEMNELEELRAQLGEKSVRQVVLRLLHQYKEANRNTAIASKTRSMGRAGKLALAVPASAEKERPLPEVSRIPSPAVELWRGEVFVPVGNGWA